MHRGLQRRSSGHSKSGSLSLVEDIPKPEQTMETHVGFGLWAAEIAGYLKIGVFPMLAAENGPQPVLFASTDFAFGMGPNSGLQLDWRRHKGSASHPSFQPVLGW